MIYFGYFFVWAEKTAVEWRGICFACSALIFFSISFFIQKTLMFSWKLLNWQKWNKNSLWIKIDRPRNAWNPLWNYIFDELKLLFAGGQSWKIKKELKIDSILGDTLKTAFRGNGWESKFDLYRFYWHTFRCFLLENC